MQFLLFKNAPKSNIFIDAMETGPEHKKVNLHPKILSSRNRNQNLMFPAKINLVDDLIRRLIDLLRQFKSISCYLLSKFILKNGFVVVFSEVVASLVFFGRQLKEALESVIT